MEQANQEQDLVGLYAYEALPRIETPDSFDVLVQEEQNLIFGCVEPNDELCIPAVLAVSESDSTHHISACRHQSIPAPFTTATSQFGIRSPE